MSLYYFLLICFRLLNSSKCVLQFLSDLVHVLEDFKASEGGDGRSKLEAELAAVKEEKQKIEERMVDVERRAAEVAKMNSSFLTQVFFDGIIVFIIITLVFLLDLMYSSLCLCRLARWRVLTVILSSDWKMLRDRGMRK